jgi:hypothetical protein
MDDRIEAGSIALLRLVFALLRSLVSGFHVRRNLVLENLALRHQLVVLSVAVPSRSRTAARSPDTRIPAPDAPAQ